MVVGHRVQERGLAMTPDIVDHSGHQGGSVASSACIGVGADSADLDESRYAEPLASHGEQATGLEYALEISQFDGADTKGARLGEFSQLQHRGNVVNCQSAKCDSTGEACDAHRARTLIQHLNQ